ncbi:hypothetical protein EV361DRAFT_947380 [Lentinula raphanica]|nr:hypothetical protein FB446DRAFT_732450 [Lentinula raphanica]KAJ3974048.1 hypothetical protein EV361DRAFT_947380 [Lentinula raphanica]
MNHMLRRSCRIQLVADTAAISFLLAIQLGLIYLLWVKDRFFIPPELLVAGFIETVLVTLLLQIIAVIQLALVLSGVYGYFTHRTDSKDDGGYRIDVRDLFFGVLYIPLCVGGAFLTAMASRAWHTKPLEGGADVFIRTLPLALVVFAVVPGVYVVYHGSQSSLLRSPTRTAHSASSESGAGVLTGQDLKLIAMGSLLLPVYGLLILFPYGPFLLIESTPIHTVMDINKLMAIITFILSTSTGIGIASFLCVVGIQASRRQWRRTLRPQPDVDLDILHVP